MKIKKTTKLKLELYIDAEDAQIILGSLLNIKREQENLNPTRINQMRRELAKALGCQALIKSQDQHQTASNNILIEEKLSAISFMSRPILY